MIPASHDSTPRWLRLLQTLHLFGHRVRTTHQVLQVQEATNYTQDHKKNWYCKRHARCKPKDPHPHRLNTLHKYPRKTKNLLKQGVSFKIYGTIYGKIEAKGRHLIRFEGNGKYMAPMFKGNIAELINVAKCHRKNNN